MTRYDLMEQRIDTSHFIATPPILWISAAIVALVGLAFAIGGIWLIAVGGTWYYLLAAIALLITAALLVMRRQAALWVYAAIVLGTLIWAVGEVGLDWWQLAPRGDVIVLLGLWLLVPWVTRRLEPTVNLLQGPGLALPAALAIALVVGVVSAVNDPHRIDGEIAAGSGIPIVEAAGVPPGEWHAYGRTAHGRRYSPLDQITPENVGRLQVAWTYNTGDIKSEEDTTETTYEVTPLKVGDALYICTPHSLAIALDAATGVELWRFDPGIGPSKSRQHQTCRGVSYYESSDTSVPEACRRRIFLPTADARLFALSARTGEVCPQFGEDGHVNLWAHMPHLQEGFYYSTSPPVIADGVLVIGGAVNDNVSTTEPSGVIRGYDADTGRLLWNWDSGNPDSTEPLGPNETYTANSPNAWSILSADPELGLVYAPLGNAPPDQFGGNRSDEVERFSSSVVALDIRTGALRWVFQTVHHDLWDYDVPSQPTLVDLTINGAQVPALIQPTKQGDIYVLDRRTGAPLLPVEERPVPQGAAEGDRTAPTQPVSTLSFAPPGLSGSAMWGVTPFDQMICRIKFHQLRYEGRYTPPSTQGTIVNPGNFGVFNWGGVAVDPVRQVVFAAPNEVAFTVRLIPRADAETNYVSGGDPGINENYGAPYAADMGPFLSPLGLPCQAPPWGYIAAADLTTGKIVWKRKNGTVRDRAPIPLPFKMGVPSLGGPIITAGGVAFLSSTLDYFLRAYDVSTGEQLWESRLPAGGQATPMTYEQDGRQFIVVAAGGHGSLGTKVGDSIIAYALPPN